MAPRPQRPPARLHELPLSEVIPLLPSCAGQSLCLSTSTGITCHQIALMFMS